ncbi:MAG: AbrB/MazE/SpoVT family DNA-binding domain-containing protein [Thermoprotei archaeon]|nr:MAG: AbrB/MazE/SpoVT family DNA-binding domain-containing protein [Thermoprotei archaeon]
MAACEEAFIGKRYTLVIPKSVREEVGLKEGQRVLVRAEAGKVIIEPLPSDPYRVLGEIIGEPYDEAKEEEKAKKWLEKHAGR